jgi:hypothetical protein
MGRQVANILDMKIDTTGSTATRPDSCYNLCGVILNQWDTDILNSLASTYTATSVSWLDLDSATGSVGSRTSTASKTWPKNGGQLTAAMPGNVAILVRKQVTAQRGAKRGRMYVCGVTEVITDTTAVNNITSGNVTALSTAFNNFRGNVNQTDEPTLHYSARMCVSHILTRYPPKPGQDIGSPATGQSMEVTALSVDATLATQRRRLRG